MKNVGVVQLSDGRKVEVVAEHNGPVKVRLIYEYPAPLEVHAWDWQRITTEAIPKDVYEREILRATKNKE